MRRRSGFLATLAVAGALLFPAVAQAQDMSITIDKHALLEADGSISYLVRVRCSLPGTVDFREGLAGAGQTKTGASAEGGLSPAVVCDGVTRTYKADVSLLGEERFKPGQARANVTVIACNFAGETQVCAQRSARENVVVSNRKKLR